MIRFLWANKLVWPCMRPTIKFHGSFDALSCFYSLNKGTDANQSTEQPSENHQTVSISKEDLQAMRNFMANPQLSEGAGGSGGTHLKLDHSFFSDPEQVLSLQLLKLSSPTQFISQFNKYENCSDANIKLLVLHQYHQVGGHANSGGCGVEQLAHRYLEQLLNQQQMDKLGCKQLQTLLELYSNYEGTYKLPKFDLKLEFGNEGEQLGNQILPTGLLVSLLSGYHSDIQSVVRILSRIGLTEPIRDHELQNRYSCQQLFKCFLLITRIVHKDIGYKSLAQELQDAITKSLLNLRSLLIPRLESDLKNPFNELSHEYKSTLSLVMEIIRAIPQMSQYEDCPDSRFLIVQELDRVMAGYLNQNKAQQGGKILVHLLYHILMTIEQNGGRNEILRGYVEIVISKCEGFEFEMGLTEYYFLWQSAVLLHRLRDTINIDCYRLVDSFVGCHLEHNSSISSEFEEVFQFQEQLSHRQRLLFEILVAYKYIVSNLTSSNNNIQQYLRIKKQLEPSNRNDLANKLIIQLRNIYEHYLNSDVGNQNIRFHMAIVAIIADGLTPQHPHLLSIFCNPVIRQALHQYTLCGTDQCAGPLKKILQKQ